MEPVLEEVSEECTNVEVVKVDVARNPNVAQMFGITSVPTIIFMQNKCVKGIIRGLSNKKALISMIKNCIGKTK
jgi:thioredoxin 1